MLNRSLVLEALFSFAIISLYCSISSSSVAGPGEGTRPHLAQVRVMFDDPTPGQHRPVVVKRAGKQCHKCQPKNEAQLDPKSGSQSEARSEMLQKHMGQCQKAHLAQRLEERRRELQEQQITPVAVRR